MEKYGYELSVYVEADSRKDLQEILASKELLYDETSIRDIKLYKSVLQNKNWMKSLSVSDLSGASQKLVLSRLNLLTGNYNFRKIYDDLCKKSEDYPDVLLEYLPETRRYVTDNMAYLDDLYNSEDKQIIIFSNCYFVMQKLQLLAVKNKTNIPILIHDKHDEKKTGWRQYDLKDGLPSNDFSDLNMYFYEEAVELAFE